TERPGRLESRSLPEPPGRSLAMLTVVLCPHCHQRCRVAAGCIGHCPACHRPFQSPPLALPVAEEGAAPSSSAWWIGALVLGIAPLAGLCLALGLVCPRPGSMLPEGEIASRADLLLVAGIFLTTLLLSLAPSLIAAARGHPNLA